jgi:hypothetical protein
MPVAAGVVARSGWESESSISPSILTALADRATERFNELREDQFIDILLHRGLSKVDRNSFVENLTQGKLVV